MCSSLTLRCDNRWSPAAIGSKQPTLPPLARSGHSLSSASGPLLTQSGHRAAKAQLRLRVRVPYLNSGTSARARLSMEPFVACNSVAKISVSPCCVKASPHIHRRKDARHLSDKRSMVPRSEGLLLALVHDSLSDLLGRFTVSQTRLGLAGSVTKQGAGRSRRPMTQIQNLLRTRTLD
jgi:hypothetical protein